MVMVAFYAVSIIILGVPGLCVHVRGRYGDRRGGRSDIGYAKMIYNKHHRNAPAEAVYIGRGSPWGNPFVIGADGDRDEVCDRFEREVLPTLDIERLRGRPMVCFCAPSRCHGDSILKALNRKPE